MSDFDAKFMQDEELRSLLRQWSVPDTPGSLDQRVAATYQQSMGSPTPVSNSALHPQGDSEVVTMKFCNTCQEQFADRFSFCPVDGSPLSAVPAQVPSTPAAEIEASYPVADTSTVQRATVAPFETPPEKLKPAPASVGTTMIGEYHLTILEDKGLVPRLAGELGEVAHNYELTWPEFKRDPMGFIKRSVQGYGQVIGGFFARRDAVIGILISLLAMGVLVVMLVVLDHTNSVAGSRIGLTVVALVAFASLIAIFATWLSRDNGAAIMGARPSDSRNVLSGIVAAFVIVFGVVGVYMLWSFWHQRAAAAAQANEDDVELTQMISDIPNEQ